MKKKREGGGLELEEAISKKLGVKIITHNLRFSDMACNDNMKNSKFENFLKETESLKVVFTEVGKSVLFEQAWKDQRREAQKPVRNSLLLVDDFNH